MARDFYIVDVFAERPYSGNPLAVVVGASTLSDEEMLRFAAEMNYSETTFVPEVAEHDGGYRVRIFTPAREIAFAGHPILGTAYVLRKHLGLDGATPLRLNLAVGQVCVTFGISAEGRDLVWFLAPPVTVGPTCAREAIAAALGLPAEEIESGAPVQQMSAGTSAMIVPLRRLRALQRSRFDLDAYGALAAQGFPPLVYVFCRETYSPENDLCARFFFEARGVREDPATGNGAAFLGTYLLEHRLCEPNFSLRIEQGYEIHRPSLVMLQGRLVNGLREVRVGGTVLFTVRGELL